MKQNEIRLCTAVIMATMGLLLLFVALFIPPQGVIDTSVLVAFGEVLTFAGALFGIDYAYRIRNHQ